MNGRRPFLFDVHEIVTMTSAVANMSIYFVNRWSTGSSEPLFQFAQLICRLQARAKTEQRMNFMHWKKQLRRKCSRGPQATRGGWELRDIHIEEWCCSEVECNFSFDDFKKPLSTARHRRYSLLVLSSCIIWSNAIELLQWAHLLTTRVTRFNPTSYVILKLKYDFSATQVSCARIPSPILQR